MSDDRGYFGIGIYSPRHEENIGTLWRSAMVFGADFIFTIGKDYKHQPSDTVKAPRHMPLYPYRDFDRFVDCMPRDALLVAVELADDFGGLVSFQHPERAIYLLGNESSGLPAAVIERCHRHIRIPTPTAFSLNVAVAGSLVLYDRFAKASA